MHVPVLLNEAIELLAIQSEDVVVDGTFGGGGHSKEIRRRFTGSTLICVDLDEKAHHRFDASGLQNAVFVHANFKDADSILEQTHAASVNKVLLDLGTSTFQLLEDTRGFSFHSATSLAMSFSEAGSHTGFTASDIVNTWNESSIADIIFYYGEDRAARKIASAIVSARLKSFIATAKQLAEIIATAVPKHSRIHPATKTFQALRIAVNDELNVIREALDAWCRRLSPKGRIAVITFHSLEDRIVKKWIREHKTIGRSVTKKPVTASAEELLNNPRARSAKLRVFELL